MHDLDAIRQRYTEVFGASTLDTPKGCSLARADIPALLSMLDELSKKFEMLGVCLCAVILKSGGHVDLPINVVKKLSESYKQAAKFHALTAIKIDEMPGDIVRLSTTQSQLIKDEELSSPSTDALVQTVQSFGRTK